jgi:hypothetical protein
MDMAEKKRTISFVLAICIMMVLLFSMFYVAAESNHDCADRSCPVCYQISVCKDTLRTLSISVAVAGILSATFMELICMPICPKQNLLITLVTLKVKLSN